MSHRPMPALRNSEHLALNDGLRGERDPRFHETSMHLHTRFPTVVSVPRPPRVVVLL